MYYVVSTDIYSSVFCISFGILKETPLCCSFRVCEVCGQTAAANMKVPQEAHATLSQSADSRIPT